MLDLLLKAIDTSSALNTLKNINEGGECLLTGVPAGPEGGIYPVSMDTSITLPSHIAYIDKPSRAIPPTSLVGTLRHMHGSIELTMEGTEEFLLYNAQLLAVLPVCEAVASLCQLYDLYAKLTLQHVKGINAIEDKISGLRIDCYQVMSLIARNVQQRPSIIV